MLKRFVFHKLKNSPLGELVSRSKDLYGIFDERGKRVLLLLYTSYISASLMSIFSFAGVAALFIVLGKPDMVLDHRYMVAAYDMLGFESRRSFLLLICGILVVSIIFQKVVNFLLILINTRLMGGLTRRCVMMLYGYYMTQSYENLIKTGATLALTKNMMMTEGMVKTEISRNKTLFNMLIDGLLISSFLFATFTWTASIMLFVVMLFFFGFFIYYKEQARILGKSDYKRRIEKTRVLKEGSSAAIEIRVMGKENEFVDRIQAIMVSLLKNSIKNQIIQQAPNLLLQVTGVLLLYIVATVEIFSRGTDYAFPVLVLFAAAAFKLSPSLQSFYSMLIGLEGSRHRYQILMGDLKEAKRTFEQEKKLLGQSELARIENAVVFDAVTYSYPGAKEPAIRDLSISLPANKVVVLFGESGVGKTTLIWLISGLLAPHKGQILVDGKSLHEDEAFKVAWRRSFGISFQKPFFMDTTLAMNIAFESEKKKINYERIHEVVKLTQLEKLIEELPDGVDTELAEDAGTLSGGQRQRIAIARALYRNSPVLVFDEATNSIDLAMERKIVSSLTKANEGKLIIIISHRTEVMKFADMVLFMKKDKSAVYGNFDQLLEEDHEFKTMIAPVIAPVIATAV